ncbi:PEP-CTERM sorting domain-containing protein [Aquisalimonas sp.]|uniref:PEP-CTERM sorting domain-containing protein n=1 Tax=unclassified Aquisalimonas TaxID=2644645 RepID=UPI0025BAF64A|nr:PEP-CTERM sorting domain-containing protein [Aquisalimonas sp.]
MKRTSTRLGVCFALCIGLGTAPAAFSAGFMSMTNGEIERERQAIMAMYGSTTDPGSDYDGGTTNPGGSDGTDNPRDGQSNPVPEPGSLMLFGAGMVALGYVVLRRKPV